MSYYEENGPDAKEVRQITKKKIIIWLRYKWGKTEPCGINKEQFFSHKLDKILCNHIPDGTSFGSYRGFACFGMATKITNNINVAIEEYITQCKDAMDIFKIHLVPLIMHWLYKPDSTKMKLLNDKYEPIMKGSHRGISST
jgi:hypothetical protein